MMFRRATPHYGHAPEPETPYQRAAQVWDDRIGTARAQAKNWRLIAFAVVGLCALLILGLLYQASRGTVTPWVVEVDRLGHIAATGPAERAWRPSDALIAYQLAHFVMDVRTVPADSVVLRGQWLRAYDFTDAKGAAALNDYARANDPFALMQKAQIAVEVTSVIRASDNSFRVAWTERRYSDGALAATDNWTAILTIAIAPPHDADSLRKNPLGVFVTAINWSKEYKQ